MDVVRSKLREFIRGSFLVDEFADEDSFLASGLIDSLGMMQLVSFVESEWGLTVKDTDLVPENFDSVANVAAFVARERARAA
jgi:acyl carrier protein